MTTVPLCSSSTGFLPHILGSQAVDEAVDLILDSLQCQRLNKSVFCVTPPPPRMLAYDPVDEPRSFLPPGKCSNALYT